MLAYRAPLLMVAFLVTATATAEVAGGDDKKPAPKQEPASEDYSAELPRIPLKSPAESQKLFAVRPGFHVELAAAEPLLRSPVAMDFDENGRLYVAEFPEYNQHGGTKPHGTGCIRLLEDKDGDGVYDNCTLYAPNVPTATAVVCWDGGVYVGSAPDLIYLKDTDGDGKADLRRVVFTGFAPDVNGESIMNSFRWGFDNRFHVATSLGGGNVRGAGQPNAKTVSVRGHGFLFDPRTETFELAGGGGQHGMSMDDWGRTYVCENSDPYQLVMYDSRYLARNPYLQAPPAAVNIGPAGKDGTLYRISTVEPWRVLKTRLRSQGKVARPTKGGPPSDSFTGASGITVYRGDIFPPEFRGNLFVGDVAYNFVHRAIAVPNRLRVTARRADVGREFLASTDNCFRPVQMANGPDGCLWIIDMYRELIEGAAFLPPPILKHMDVASGVDHGRIWRVVPDGHKPRLAPNLSKAPTAELIALLEHPNGWHRDTASRLLYERQDQAAIEPLRRLASSSRSPLARAHAIHALAGLGGLRPDDVLAPLSDPEPRVREHALRLAEPFGDGDHRIQKRMDEMVADTDPLVRYQLAFSLGSLAGTRPAPALAALAVRDGADRWIRMAILSSITRCAGEVFRSLAANRDFRSSAAGRAFLSALAAQTAANRPQDVGIIVDSLNGPLAADQILGRDLVSALMAGMPVHAQAKLFATAGGRAGAIFAGLLADARNTAVDEAKKPSARAAAVRFLRFAGLDDVSALLAELLSSRQPLELQAAAVETLAGHDDTRVGSILLTAWPGMSPKLKATAAEALFARPRSINAFLDAIETGKVDRADVDPARLDLLKKYPDESVRARASRIFASALPRRLDVVARYQKALQIQGDRQRGKAVFQKNCSSCHRLENVGQAIGANLSAIRDRGLEAVLLNILDPNREVLPQYQTYIVVTTEGRVITGLITAETTNNLTIRKPDGGGETVLRLEIDELRSTGQSFMPEGLEKQIDVPAMADLLAYLNTVR